VRNAVQYLKEHWQRHMGCDGWLTRANSVTPLVRVRQAGDARKGSVHHTRSAVSVVSGYSIPRIQSWSLLTSCSSVGMELRQPSAARSCSVQPVLARSRPGDPELGWVNSPRHVIRERLRRFDVGEIPVTELSAGDGGATGMDGSPAHTATCANP
jgi:hypothetical protein